MSEIVDPPEAPDAGERLRAKDLRGKYVVLHPTATGSVEGRDGKPWTFVTCDVWEIDRAGIVQSATDVRISWWRVREQLATMIGSYVAAKVVEDVDNSIFLQRMPDAAMQIVRANEATIKAGASSDESVAYAPDEEPF